MNTELASKLARRREWEAGGGGPPRAPQATMSKPAADSGSTEAPPRPPPPVPGGSGRSSTRPPPPALPETRAYRTRSGRNLIPDDSAGVVRPVRPAPPAPGSGGAATAPRSMRPAPAPPVSVSSSSPSSLPLSLAPAAVPNPGNGSASSSSSASRAMRPAPVPPVQPVASKPASDLSDAVIRARELSVARRTTPPTPPKPPVTRHRMKDNPEVEKARKEVAYLAPALTRFYQHNNPSKIKNVNTILGVYALGGGGENGIRILNQKLMEEYGEDLSAYMDAPADDGAAGTTGKLGTNGSEEQQQQKGIRSGKSSGQDSEPPLTITMRFARVLYDFNDDLQPGDLALQRGQVVELLDTSKDWWKGRTLTMEPSEGFFPSNYVAEIPEAEGLKCVAVQSGAASEEDAKESKLLVHYFKAISEVVTSEFRYVTDLHVFRRVFVVPMNDSLGRDLVTKLFPAIGDMIGVHEKILEELMRTLPSLEALLITTDPRSLDRGSAPPPAFYDADAISNASQSLASNMREWGEQLKALELGFCQPGLHRSAEDRAAITEALGQWAVRMSQAMIVLSQFLKASNPYINNYPAARDKVESFTGEQMQVLTTLEQHRLLRGLKLRDYMIKPVQRVCKYPLLFREIIKYSSDETCKAVVELGQDKLIKVADEVNTMLKVSENASTEKLMEMRMALRPRQLVDSLGINSPTCVLVREGMLSVVGCDASAQAPEGRTMKMIADQLAARPPDTVRGILFTELFVICEQYSNLMSKTRLSIKHSFRFTQWHGVTVTAHESRADCFVFSVTHDPAGPAKGGMISWTLCPGAAPCAGWIADFNETIGLAAKVKARENLVKQVDQKKQEQRAKKKGSMADELPNRPILSGFGNFMDELGTFAKGKRGAGLI